MICFVLYFLILNSVVQGQEVACGADQFKCANGNCIDKTLQCNLKNDCGDRSEELPCVYCEKPLFLYKHCTNRESAQVMLPAKSLFKNNYVAALDRRADLMWIKRDQAYFDAICGKTKEIIKCNDDHNGLKCKEKYVNSLPFLSSYLPLVCKGQKEYMKLYTCLAASKSDRAGRIKYFEDCVKKNLDAKKLAVPKKNDCSELEAMKEVVKCASETVHKFDATCGTQEELYKFLYQYDFGIPALQCPEPKKPGLNGTAILGCAPLNLFFLLIFCAYILL